ncbi:MAG: N4-gp56 family major capsid protein, partial [bacterium]
MAITTTTQIPPAVSEFYDKLLLVRALPNLVHDRFGQRRDLPPNNSGTIKFRRYESLSVATTPLTEGTTPSSVQLSKTDISANIDEYGNYIEITDKVNLLNVDKVLTEATNVLGENAGQSLDVLTRDILVAGTNVQYSNGSARNAINTIIDTTTLQKAIRTLEGNNAKYHTTMIEGSTKIATIPIAPAYWAIVHPDVAMTLRNLTDFIPVEKYANQQQVMKEEIGAYRQIRFVTSTQTKIWTGAGAATTSIKNTGGVADVYATLIFGTDA